MDLLPTVAALCAAFMSFHAHADIVLHNDRWRVAIDPATLAIATTIPGKPIFKASEGGPAHRVSMDENGDLAAVWRWDDDAYRVDAKLDGDDLTLTLRASAKGEVTLARQPAEAMGRGLVLPIAEGHYVPRGQAVWQRYLTKDLQTADTAEELSLPLWGNDYGDHSLTWILPDSFDNRLTFHAQGNAVIVSLTHRFTPLAHEAPVTAILHRGSGDDDLLDGAKRYRRWLIEHGRFESMADKIARTPDTKRLLGATHVYLWGTGLLAPTDVSDWKAFTTLLRGDAPLAVAIREQMTRDALASLDDGANEPNAYERRSLVDAMNDALANLARRQWMGDESDMDALTQAYASLHQQVVELFGAALTADPSQWGGGLSGTTMKRLHDAGLSRLWLGLGDGWEGGLWHPEAVAAAVANGFLIAPYDSYETALPNDADRSWTTAHAGERAFRDCGIAREDGSAQAGFAGKGRYTDPRCMKPLMQSRIASVRARVPFNSWFLDAYATGMSFESYRKGATMTRAQNVDGAVANVRWVERNEHVPVGSEGGNAMASGGIAFAHGMQVPVIGWGDVDMGQSHDRNTSSRYFVGGWYPSSEPKIFFSHVPLKDTYRTIHYDPTFRLPLYQAVFHDSIVTTNHWLYDNLKFDNVRIENQLTQMLYNVPGLYHLSTDTLSKRLPTILRHDAFFRPLHEVLATQAMTRFEWLSSDRLAQRTTFADGTRLTANFGSKPVTYDGGVLAPRSVVATRPDGCITRFADNWVRPLVAINPKLSGSGPCPR